MLILVPSSYSQSTSSILITRSAKKTGSVSATSKETTEAVELTIDGGGKTKSVICFPTWDEIGACIGKLFGKMLFFVFNADVVFTMVLLVVTTSSCSVDRE